MDPMHRGNDRLHDFIVFSELSKNDQQKSTASGKKSEPLKNPGAVLAASLLVIALLLILFIVGIASGSTGFLALALIIGSIGGAVILNKALKKSGK